MAATDTSTFMLIAMLAMVISMAVTPVMIRLAPLLGMVDHPGSRKVHTLAIPRSGGVGIVVGIIVPLAMLLSADAGLTSILIGCTILLVFGAWDDARNIRPAIKFFGQFLAAGILVYYGEIYVSHMPFMGLTEVPEVIGKPFTLIAIVGMINALNLSDGLDGLAGGEALISLIAIAYLSYLYEGALAISIAAASIGGVFGFLRFNSHPAKVFMGDAGSQTLGYILGALVVYLTQNVNPVMSPASALLLLGLPIMDSLVVFSMRAKRGDSLVVAAKDHLHHRLLSIGFYHYESVSIIYSLQIFLVLIALLIPYESDVLLMAIFTVTAIVIYTPLIYSERHHLKIRANVIPQRKLFSHLIADFSQLERIPYQVLEYGLIIVLLSAAVMATDIPADIGFSSVVLLLCLIVAWILGAKGIVWLRFVIYITAGTATYLLSMYPPEWLLEELVVAYAFYFLLVMAGFTAVRLCTDNSFSITPLDFLVILLVIIVALLPDTNIEGSKFIWIAIQTVILFYSAELLIQRLQTARCQFSWVLLASLTLVAARVYL